MNLGGSRKGGGGESFTAGILQMGRINFGRTGIVPPRRLAKKTKGKKKRALPKSRSREGRMESSNGWGGLWGGEAIKKGGVEGIAATGEAITTGEPGEKGGGKQTFYSREGEIRMERAEKRRLL